MYHLLLGFRAHEECFLPHKNYVLLETHKSETYYYCIRYICQLQLGYHAVAVVQYTFAHKQYIEQHK